MGLKLSRKIRLIREKILLEIKKINSTTYNYLVLIGAFFKFIYKINKTKKSIKFSKNLDEINFFEYKLTSQNNEDGIIDFLITKIGISNLNFIEIGFDYYENNSINIIKRSKKGLFIDGSEEKVFLLKKILRLLYFYKDINVINDYVNKDNINFLISKYFKKDDEIDFLSIDVDGIDYYLFENLEIRPKFICIEYNFWYGKDKKCSIPYSKDFKWEMGSLYSGASLLAINDLANSKDYYLVALESSCTNAFFVRGDLKKNFNILNPSTSYKIPSRYSINEIEKGQNKLISKDLTFF